MDKRRFGVDYANARVEPEFERRRGFGERRAERQQIANVLVSCQFSVAFGARFEMCRYVADFVFVQRIQRECGQQISYMLVRLGVHLSPSHETFYSLNTHQMPSWICVGIV